jgi:GNAT superfamily N-acetyltransferase
MSGAVGQGVRMSSQRGGWSVRLAREEDVEAITGAVSELLAELGSTPPDRSAMLAAARELVYDERGGVVLLGESEHEIIGMLAASWQSAIHVPGRYALIQDLWVHPRWRRRAVGRGLLEQLQSLAQGLQIGRIEVGLPQEKFAGLAETTSFYSRNGFEATGDRMRRRVP